jgi:hypothetical protein
MIVVICIVNAFRIHLTAGLLKTISFAIIMTENRKFGLTILGCVQGTFTLITKQTLCGGSQTLPSRLYVADHRHYQAEFMWRITAITKQTVKLQ